MESPSTRKRQELRRELKNYRGVASTIQSSWTGSNATRYLGKMTEMEEKLEAQAKIAEELASAIEQTVAAYRKEQTNLYYQEQAAKKAKSSSGGGGGHSIGGGRKG